MRTSITLFCTLLVVPFAANAQSLVGVWKGELLQDPRSKFYFEIRVEEQSAEKITGHTYIKGWDNKGSYGTISFVGKLNSEGFLFQEQKIVREEKFSSGFYWCIKQGLLQLQEHGNQLVLKGPWSASGCSPGTLTVYKERERTPTVTTPPPVVEAPPVVAPPVMATPSITPPPVVTKPVSTEPTDPRTIFMIEGRKVDREEKPIVVRSPELDLQIWDAVRMDSDVVSLNLNGRWLARQVTVPGKAAPISWRLELLPGENLLVMYAENMGSKGSNTAAISVNDGHTTQKVLLRSTTGASAGIRIVYAMPGEER